MNKEASFSPLIRKSDVMGPVITVGESEIFRVVISLTE